MKHPVTRALAVLMALLMLLSAVAVAEEAPTAACTSPAWSPPRRLSAPAAWTSGK